ncbi:snf2 family helicase atpase [Stemphylium lycopersici]|uniref:DNA helicase n=1 Tax=Stemphylium lycopersici TaxID=183478 RepID=A0A364N6P8_STELY|nr:snf2 family helicase atpase [Stemphylium lycopersici]
MEQPTQQQPRQRGLSFHSNKSREPPATPKSPKSPSKHERKHSDHYDPNSKANPNAAMVEQQPMAAALEKPTLQSLRSFQHTDASGNPIADPDFSNPTRSRWERPLDTIRSFEAAIDGEYRRRAQSMRADQTDIMSSYGSRRSSYYGGGGGGYNDQNRYSTTSGYFPQRQSGRDSYADGYGNGGPVGGGPPPRMRYGNRMQSDPGWNNRQSMQGVYPMNGYQQSRDTVNTNGSSGSHSDGPYSNDPSSENSSIERGVPVQPPQQDFGSHYGFNGSGRGPIMEEYAQGPGQYSQGPPPPPPHNNGMAPPPPKHATPAAPIKLGGGDASGAEPQRPKMLSKNSSNGGEKRKSWFKKRYTMYRRDPIVSSSPPPAEPRATSHSDDERQDPYVTQPTQILGARSPFFAAPTDTTQPTQILTPRANRVQPAASSQLQVPRSSPTTQRLSSPPLMSPSQSQRPYGGFSNPMAPPGTGFFPPQAVRKPVVDLTSDDPPVERDPDEDESEYRSNIPLSKIEMGSMASRIEETPQKPTWDLSGYKYNSDQSRKRPSEGPGSSTPPKRQKLPLSRQGGPSRALPVDLTEETEMTLEDIKDFALQRNVKRLQAIYPNRSVKQLHEALLKNKRDFNDASSYLADQESEDELLRSPQFGVAQSKSNPVAKKTAQRGLKQPVQSLQNKYSKLGATQSTPLTIDSPEKEAPKKKGRLLSGKDRKQKMAFSPSPEPTPPRPQQHSKKQAPIVVSSDEDEGIAADLMVDDDSDASVPRENSFNEDALLKFFNTCTVEAMVDLSGHKEDDIKEIFEHRPFASFDAIRKVHVDLTPVEKGKKKARKPRITTGARLVESTEGMWNAYSTIDSVVKQCEALGKPMVAGMARWGIDIFGASTEDGVDVTSLDDSDTNSSRDSGYHTPRSPNGSDTESKSIRKAVTRTKLLKQPSNMNDDIELKDYQVVGLNWLNLLWQTETSGILADDMGLGKTCQIIAFLSHLKQEGNGKPALIVVPGSTLENWCREFERFSNGINFTPYYGSQAERFSHQESIHQNIRQGTCDVIITTYDLTFRKEDLIFLKKCRPEICIFDEGHMLKNANTIRYKSLMKIPTKCRILLTGTPLQNSLQELMSILGFLMPQVFYGDQQEEVQEMLQILFKHKAKTMESDSHSSLLSAQRIQRARTMLTPFILRRKKAQVLKHLPKKTSRVEYCDLTATQKTLYNEQLAKQRKILEDRAAGIPVKDHANVMMKLRQAAIHPLLFRHRYDNDTIRKMSKACLREDTFAESNPDIIYEELELYQDYQCHQLATKYRALKKFALQNSEWMDSGKVTALLALLQQYKKNGDRALVFSQFTSVMDILGWVFDDHDINFMRMDGSTPIAERQSLMDVFYADTSIQLFMISTKSGGAGINLACANKVVIFDSSFNPQDDIQAENRAHRVGQTREVEVVRLVTKGTVEEQIYKLGVSKLELDKMVQGEEDGGAGAKGKGKKKDEAAGAGLSKAEEAGIQAVEMMMMQQLQAPEENESGSGSGSADVKEQYMNGLKKAGLDIAA